MARYDSNDCGLLITNYEGRRQWNNMMKIFGEKTPKNKKQLPTQSFICSGNILQERKQNTGIFR